MRTVVAEHLGTLPNPVVIPPQDPATQDLGVTETTEGPNGGAQLVQSRYISGGPAWVPDLEQPPATDRPAMHALVMFLGQPEQRPAGTGHGSIVQGITSPPGLQLTGGDPQRGNSFRLMPEPWDSAIYGAAQTGDGTSDYPVTES